MQSLEVISVNIWQIVISLANLLIMFLILKKLLFKPVQDIIAKRKEQVEKIYSDARDSRGEADRMKQEYEQHLAGARAEADAIVTGARDSARRKSDEILHEASADAARIKQKAEEEIESERRQMLAEVRGEIADLSVDIASRVVGRAIDQKDYEGFVDDFIKNVGEKQ